MYHHLFKIPYLRDDQNLNAEFSSTYLANLREEFTYSVLGVPRASFSSSSSSSSSSRRSSFRPSSSSRSSPDSASSSSASDPEPDAFSPVEQIPEPLSLSKSATDSLSVLVFGMAFVTSAYAKIGSAQCKSGTSSPYVRDRARLLALAALGYQVSTCNNLTTASDCESMRHF